MPSQQEFVAAAKLNSACIHQNPISSSYLFQHYGHAYKNLEHALHKFQATSPFLGSTENESGYESPHSQKTTNCLDSLLHPRMN